MFELDTFGRRWPLLTRYAPVTITPELLEAARAYRPVAYVVARGGQVRLLDAPLPPVGAGWPSYMRGVDWSKPSGGFGPLAPAVDPDAARRVGRLEARRRRTCPQPR